LDYGKALFYEQAVNRPSKNLTNMKTCLKENEIHHAFMISMF